MKIHIVCHTGIHPPDHASTSPRPGHPPSGNTVNGRAVHILLECILVFISCCCSFSAVVFSVRLSADIPFALNVKIIFDNVNVNVGKGYNVTTGVFTVPHNGTYELTLTVMGTHAASANIMRADNGLCQAYAKEGSIIGNETNQQQART